MSYLACCFEKKVHNNMNMIFVFIFDQKKLFLPPNCGLFFLYGLTLVDEFQLFDMYSVAGSLKPSNTF